MKHLDIVQTEDKIPVFHPIFGKVVIKVDTQPERRYGKLVLPQREAGRTSFGVVHAVYKKTETADGVIEPQVKVGDTVIFGQFTGTQLTLNRELYVICREHDLLSIVEFSGEVPSDLEAI